MSHGAQVEETPTGVKPAVQISAGLPVYIGTAPISSVDLTNVNKPKLCTKLDEFEAAFGPLSDDFASWTLHEAAKAHFEAYEVASIVCINVLDPTNSRHFAVVTHESHQLVDGEVQLQVYGGPDALMLGIIESTVVVKNQTFSTTYTIGSDYTLAFDDDGFLVVTRVSTGRIGASDIIMADFHYLDPSGVTTDD